MQQTLPSTYVPGIELSAGGADAPSPWLRGFAWSPEASSGPGTRARQQVALPRAERESRELLSPLLQVTLRMYRSSAFRFPSPPQHLAESSGALGAGLNL